jgi:hypothetical protein
MDNVFPLGPSRSEGLVSCSKASVRDRAADQDTADHDDATDPAAAMHADLFETLVQEFNFGASPKFAQGQCASPDQPQSAGPQPSDPVPPPPEHGNSESDGTSQLTIECFPHGSPGAPIPGADHDEQR